MPTTGNQHEFSTKSEALPGCMGGVFRKQEDKMVTKSKTPEAPVFPPPLDGHACEEIEGLLADANRLLGALVMFVERAGGDEIDSEIAQSVDGITFAAQEKIIAAEKILVERAKRKLNGV
jgi:hypothetical protein